MPKKTLPVIACGVAVVRRGRQFLIAQRNPEDSFGSFWEFPGGKRDRGETFEECVVREVKEETGLDIAPEEKLLEIRRRHNGKVIWLNFYLCRYLAGEPSALDCQQALWVDVEELQGYEFPPANERVIERLVKKYA